MQKDNYSPESQEAECRAYCHDAKRGYAVAPEHVYREVYTAKNSGDIRPELDRLKQAVIRGDVSVIVALKADRLFRDILDGMEFKNFLRRYKARVEFVLGQYDDSPLGQMMYALDLFAAENQWGAIREATRRGIAERIKEGKPLAGIKPCTATDG